MLIDPDRIGLLQMLTPERWTRILDLVNRDGGVRTTPLAEAMRASLPTVRRDLEFLGHQGLLIRTPGGAVTHSRSITYEPPYRQGCWALQRRSIRVTSV
jgi:DeoR/GlpR family transcriptional regulator of sugar metabolism